MNIQLEMNVPADYLDSGENGKFVTVKGTVGRSGKLWGWSVVLPHDVRLDLKDNKVGSLSYQAKKLLEDNIVPVKP